jgi:hypothetical protein
MRIRKWSTYASKPRLLTWRTINVLFNYLGRIRSHDLTEVLCLSKRNHLRAQFSKFERSLTKAGSFIYWNILRKRASLVWALRIPEELFIRTTGSKSVAIAWTRSGSCLSQGTYLVKIRFGLLLNETNVRTERLALDPGPIQARVLTWISLQRQHTQVEYVCSDLVGNTPAYLDSMAHHKYPEHPSIMDRPGLRIFLIPWMSFFENRAWAKEKVSDLFPSRQAHNTF